MISISLQYYKHTKSFVFKKIQSKNLQNDLMVSIYKVVKSVTSHFVNAFISFLCQGNIADLPFLE